MLGYIELLLVGKAKKVLPLTIKAIMFLSRVWQVSDQIQATLSRWCQQLDNEDFVGNGGAKVFVIVELAWIWIGWCVVLGLREEDNVWD